MKPIRFLPKIKRGQVCLNCDLPLAGEENFCPNCGQRNDVRSLNFGSFLYAVFSEFISYDSRLWRTIIALVIHPGKVSREYIDGKRFRYANPFRFYLTISIVFFVLLGFINKYEKLNGKGTSRNIIQINTDNGTDTKEKLKKEFNKKFDSIKEAHPENTDLKDLETNVIKPILKKSESKNNDFNLDSLSLGKENIGLAKKLQKYNGFYKSHKTLPVNKALDSLGEAHTFWNRFYYSKIQAVYKIIEDKGDSLSNKIMSNLSIALFILLPIFTVFLKLLYIRRRLNYMEHLIFVFNTQSVFFLLMILLLLTSLFTESNTAPVIFVLMFLVYLYLALRKFYKQGWFKTFIKFNLLNMIYSTLAIIGIVIVFLIAFLIG
ncbi:MAG: DUF3667 domain-containing protein [Flavobacteriaceae bacterium]